MSYSHYHYKVINWYIVANVGQVRLSDSTRWEKVRRLPGYDEEFGHSFIGDWVGMVMVF